MRSLRDRSRVRPHRLRLRRHRRHAAIASSTCGAHSRRRRRAASRTAPAHPRRARASCSTRISPTASSIENLFHAQNVKSALVLGHARGVAVLAAVAGRRAGASSTRRPRSSCAVAGYGRAEKTQMQQMVKLLLGLDTAPSPHDAADALAVAICHAHAAGRSARPSAAARAPRAPAQLAARQARRSDAAARRRDRAPAPARCSRSTCSGSIVDVGGVGYDVLVPLSTFYAVGEPGQPGRAAHPHARARGRAAAVRLRDAARTVSCSSG